MEKPRADALKDGKNVSVDTLPAYVGAGARATSFMLEYKVDNILYKVFFKNRA